MVASLASESPYHLFFSYAHRDDVAPRGVQMGWVGCLREELVRQLGMLGGREDLILWSDERLDPADIVDRQLDEAVQKSAILVAILSASYVESEWCTRELLNFVREVESRESRASIYIVEIREIPRDEMPKQFQNRNTLVFWDRDPRQPGKTVPKAWPIPIPTHPDHQEYYRDVHNLADDIVAKLKEIGLLGNGGATSQDTAESEAPSPPANGSAPAEVFHERFAPNDTENDFRDKIFINIDPSRLDAELLRKVESAVNDKGFQTFNTEFLTEISDRRQALTKSFFNSKGVVMIHSEGGEDWMRAQWGQLNKIGATRPRPLDFILTVTSEPAHEAGWLQDLLDASKLQTTKRLVNVDELSSLDLK